MEKLHATHEERKLVARATKGVLSAQLDLAVGYATGDGLRKDLSQSRYWYQKAAEQGESDAAFNLGAMILLGEGGTKSERTAMKWLKHAVALGSSDACILMADVYQSRQTKNGLLESSKLRAQAFLLGDRRGIRDFVYCLSEIEESELRRQLATKFSELIEFP